MTTSKNKDTRTKPDLQGFADKDLSTPPSWQPEQQGDWVFGKVTKIKEITIKNKKGEDEDRRILILDTETGLTAVWESAVLSDLFDELGTGEEVYIEYDGKEQLDRGRSMNKYIVKVYNGS